MKTHTCEICSGDSFHPIWVAQRYIGEDQQPPEICQNCGFCQVNARRTSAEIADDWRRLYAEKIYDPTWPGVQARLYYVAEWANQNIDLEGKTLLDLGGGDGSFVNHANTFACQGVALDPAFGGPVVESSGRGFEGYPISEKFDIVTILWTLENCGDPNAMIAKARECLKPDGHLIIATGSRILVPFRKPMSQYFSTEPQDLHAFRWSLVSLTSILTKHGFYEVRKNDFMQNDVLLVSAQPADEMPPDCFRAMKDDPAAVENHFIDWYRSFP